MWFPINEEDYETAQRLGREFSDYLRLIMDDLGWGDGTGEPVELTMPAEDLRRTFGLLHERAARSLATEQAHVAEARQMEEGSQLVLQACKRVLTTLDVQVMTR